ncbi:MAG: class I SAM-dependent methyltransferase, partial [Verrucomicrobiales bacterium]
AMDSADDALFAEEDAPMELQTDEELAEAEGLTEPAPDTLSWSDSRNAEIREAVPYGDTILTLVKQLLKHANLKIERFLDVGCGDAILPEIILNEYPTARGVLLDVDEPSLEAAWERLGDKAQNLAFVAQDIGDTEWIESVRNIAPFDLIVTSFVINQQPDDHKAAIYEDLFDLMAPGALFLNLDFVATAAPFARKLWDEMYIESIKNFRSKKKDKDKDKTALPPERAWNEWPGRTLMDPSHTDIQCEWLNEIGFVGVDCFFRGIGIAIFGGTKPKVVAPKQ